MIEKSKGPKMLLRIKQVLDRVPVSRSKWYAGVGSGLYPQPVKLGDRAVAWLSTDIDDLIDRLAGER
jgi:prophage regulatory protein